MIIIKNYKRWYQDMNSHNLVVHDIKYNPLF